MCYTHWYWKHDGFDNIFYSSMNADELELNFIQAFGESIDFNHACTEINDRHRTWWCMHAHQHQHHQYSTGQRNSLKFDWFRFNWKISSANANGAECLYWIPCTFNRWHKHLYRRWVVNRSLRLIQLNLLYSRNTLFNRLKCIKLYRL